MRKAMFKIQLSFLIGIFLLSSFSPSVYANAPYKTFTEDHNRNYVRTQDAYSPFTLMQKIGFM
jgi:hypothetical protein